MTDNMSDSEYRAMMNLSMDRQDKIIELQAENKMLRETLRTVQFEDDHRTRVDYCNKALK